VYTQLSEATRARRDADLARMRQKHQRDRPRVRRVVGLRTVKRIAEVERPVRKTMVIELAHLAHACRVAKSLSSNPVLIEHLEIAATYFEDAECGPQAKG